MTKIERYLTEFKEESNDWFNKNPWLETRYKFFKNFFKPENLAKAEWKDFQEMANNLHCFTTNSLAKANAFGRPNDTIENYRKNFDYLIRGTDPLNIRLNNLNDKKSKYKIKFVSDSALSELVGYAFPDDYVFYNSRSKKAINFLDLIIPINKFGHFGDEFVAYNEIVKPIQKSYESILGKKTSTTIPLEVDQFFSWLCDTKIKLTDKNTFFPILKNFIEQAQTDNQKYSDYPKTYEDLEIDVKFGQGALFHVPYLALLKKPNRVSDGIYPVYLYYKKDNILILSYGISESNISRETWPGSDKMQDIKSWYQKEFNEKPYRYGSSLIKAVYNIEELDPEKMQKDLNEIIKFYKESNLDISPIINTSFKYDSFLGKVREVGLEFSEKTICRFIAALCTKPFVILTGLSGSGKTKLAQTFAMWLCEKEEQYCIIPVGSDWTNREPLLGFPNALNNNDYVKPDNKVLELIIAANDEKNCNKPYFLILDEMNLSHVERYFSDFLSVMESGQKLCLHSGIKNKGNIPSELSLPSNLFIVGTVNIDETTYMFSPKVLDRANVIEFRVTVNEMDQYLRNSIPLKLDTLKSKGAIMANSFIEIASDKSLATKNIDNLRIELMTFFKELRKAGAEFGYRTASEINRFAAVINIVEPKWTNEEIIDAAIMQKLLPKLHGSRRKLEGILKALGQFCLNGNEKIEIIILAQEQIDFTDSGKIKYPISLEKILRMHNNLITNSFTSYAEA